MAAARGHRTCWQAAAEAPVQGTYIPASLFILQVITFSHLVSAVFEPNYPQPQEGDQLLLSMGQQTASAHRRL